MIDKSRVIFGNRISDKDYKKACKTKANSIKKFGDDSNVDYNIVIQKNDHIGDSLGVYDVLLKDGEIIPTIISILKTEDFYRPEHRIIFNAILKLYQKKDIPNILSLMEELSMSNELEKIGIDYIFPELEYTAKEIQRQIL